MTDDEFDAALIGGAFAVAARTGWQSVSVAAAAREADLPLDRARARFPDRNVILMQFGRHADMLALADAPDSGPLRERLFDLIMRRFDALQTHRAGVLALLRDLPSDPAVGLLLAVATTRSMGWMLEAAAFRTGGLRGAVATQGLLAIWLNVVQAWRKDDSADLSGTMAALDRALTRAERVAGWLGHAHAAEAESGPKPFPDPEAGIQAGGLPPEAGVDPGLG